MSYKIIEVHQVYANNKIEEIAVLWQSNEMGEVNNMDMEHQLKKRL